MKPNPPISLLERAAGQGESAIDDTLFSALYAELRQLAKRELARQGAAVSLSATTLLHEAYLDMAVRRAADNPVDHKELARIGEVLDEMGKVEPALAEVVDLKFFCGFSFAEIAAMRDVSERTVQRHWEKARIFLHRKIRADLSA